MQHGRPRATAAALALLAFVALLLADRGGGSGGAAGAGLRSARAASLRAGSLASDFRFMSATQLDVAGAGALTFSVPPWVWLTPDERSAAAAVASPAEATGALADAASYKAQSGEDRFALEHFFAGVRGGLVLESGALDGDMFSTSWLFERALGWRAVHVEASPRMFADLVRKRPGALNIYAALCGEHKTLHLAFVDHTDAVGGLWEFMSPKHKAEFWPGTNPSSLPAVACMPLAPLLALFGITHVDLWVLDVEGAELNVLYATDFSRVSIDVIVVETIGFDAAQDARVVAYIVSQGFVNFAVDHHNTWLVAPSVAERARRPGGAAAAAEAPAGGQ